MNLTTPTTGMALRRCGWLTLAACALWCLMAVPAYQSSGRDGLIGLTLFGFACLLPGWLVFWLVSRYGVAKSQAIVVIAGTFPRLALAFGAVLLLKYWQGSVSTGSYLSLVLFYIVVLAVETYLVLPPKIKSKTEM